MGYMPKLICGWLVVENVTDNLKIVASFIKEGKRKNIGKCNLDFYMWVKSLNIIYGQLDAQGTSPFYVLKMLINSSLTKAYNYVNIRYFLNALKYCYSRYCKKWKLY